MHLHLYEVDQSIYDCYTISEDGEITAIDEENLKALLAQRDDALDGLVTTYKEASYHAEALKAEKLKLEKRQKAYSNSAYRLKRALEIVLEGKGFENSRHKITYKTSHPVMVEDEKLLPPEFKKVEIVPDKQSIGKALKLGHVVHGAYLKEVRHLIIK